MTFTTNLFGTFNIKVPDSINKEEAEAIFWNKFNRALEEVGISIDAYDVPYAGLTK